MGTIHMIIRDGKTAICRENRLRKGDLVVAECSVDKLTERKLAELLDLMAIGADKLMHTCDRYRRVSG